MFSCPDRTINSNQNSIKGERSSQRAENDDSVPRFYSIDPDTSRIGSDSFVRIIWRSRRSGKTPVSSSFSCSRVSADVHTSRRPQNSIKGRARRQTKTSVSDLVSCVRVSVNLHVRRLTNVNLDARKLLLDMNVTEELINEARCVCIRVCVYMSGRVKVDLASEDSECSLLSINQSIKQYSCSSLEY